MAEIFANNEDPDQTPRSAASDLCLHCLQITLFTRRGVGVGGVTSYIVQFRDVPLE